MAYIGSSPTKVVSRQSANIFTYTATANQTAFTGSDANGNTLACTPSDIMVHMNGLRLEESDYTASTTTVTLGSGAAAGDEVTITAFLTFESADHYTKSAADTRYVNTAGDTMTGALTVGGAVTVNNNHVNIDSGYSYQWGDSHERIEQSDATIEFFTNNSQNMTLSGGNLGIATTENVSLATTEEGFWYQANDWMAISRASGPVAYFNRLTSDGTIVMFRKNGSNVGSMGSINGQYLYIGQPSNVGMGFISANVRPTTDGTNADNTYDFGHPSVRWDDIFATNGTINTSDENEKQNITSLTSAEITAATAISKLFKTYKWKDKVAAKGNDARTHTGVVAQQVQTAMSNAGLDASKYAFWCSDTWWEKGTDVYDTKDAAPEGSTERTRLGVRYPELLAFVSAATEQRLTNIETRLAALEGG